VRVSWNFWLHISFLDSIQKLEKQLELLQQRCTRESSILPNLLLLYWPADETATDEAVTNATGSFKDRASSFVASGEIILRPESIDRNVASLLPSLVKTRAVNSNQVPSITLASCLQPFFDTWSASMSALATESSVLEGNAKSIQLVHRAVEILLSASRLLGKAANVQLETTKMSLPQHEALSGLTDELLACGKLLHFDAGSLDQLLALAHSAPQGGQTISFPSVR
jgi:hypothetical protein